MNIVEATEPSDFNEVTKHADAPQKLFAWLFSAVPKGHLFVAIAKDGDKHLGHVVYTNKHEYSSTVFVIQCYISLQGSAEGIGDNLMQYVEERAKAMGATCLAMRTKRTPQAWHRKYGFVLDSYYMAKEI